MPVIYFSCPVHGELGKIISNPDKPGTHYCVKCDRELKLVGNKTPVGFKTMLYQCEDCGTFEDTVLEAEMDSQTCECGKPLERLGALAPPKVGNWQNNETEYNSRWKKDLTEASKLKEHYCRHRKKIDGQQLREMKIAYKRLKGEPMGV